MISTFLILMAFYGILYLILRERGVGIYLLFNFPALLAMHFGLLLWAMDGAYLTNLTLLLIILFSLCSIIPFIVTIYFTHPHVEFKKFYLARVHYFKEHVQENIVVLMILLLFATIYTFYQMYITGTFFREFYRSLVFENKMFAIMLVSSLATILCIFYFLEKRFLLVVLMFLILLTLGKKNPIFLIVLLLCVHYLVVKNDMLRPIFFAIIGTISLSYLALYHSNQSLSILVQLTSTLDYIKNFDYFVTNFKFGSLEGAIIKSEFIRYIPRILWTEKPDLYGSVLIHKSLYPAEVAVGYFPSTFETYTKYLADFGIIGLAVFLFLQSMNYLMFFGGGKFLGVVLISYQLDSNLIPFILMIVLLTKVKKTFRVRKLKHV